MAEPVPGLDIDALTGYLPGVLPGFEPGAELTARLLAGGRSNLTCLLSQPGGGQWVLRRPPLGHILPSAHDMAREFRTLSFLDGTGFPAPRPLALCTDHSVLGVTFMIYEYVTGAIIADPAVARSLTAGKADVLCRNLIRTLVRLHSVPVPDPGSGRTLSSVGYLRRQVARWIDQWHRNQTQDLPSFGRLADWLTARTAQLSSDYPVTLVHGDYRLDNLVLAPGHGRVRAVLDWEMSTFGDPLMDVALLLVYWEQPGDQLRQRVEVARELTTAPGFWTRDRLLSEYLRVTGLPPAHLDICLGLACLKLATILEGIHYRFRAGQALDELSAAMGTASPALIEMGLEVAAGHGLDALHR
jgi:aminoglycoside phosphotransferase (APT) family kinase protein